jgi:hypothetical protein
VLLGRLQQGHRAEPRRRDGAPRAAEGSTADVRIECGSVARQAEAGGRDGWATDLVRRRPDLVLFVAFAATRLVARGLLGVRFDGGTLGFWQVLDPAILRADLLRGVFFLHAQPPLYNLGLGVVLKWVPEALQSIAFSGVFLLLGFLQLVGIRALLEEFGTPRPAALAVALLQTLSTTWIAYEAWLFYTLPTAVLVTWAAVFAARAARGRAAAARAFAAAVTALAWIRSTYHPVWVAAALVLLLVAVRGAEPAVRVTARRAALVALVLTLALPAKNLLLVGSFSSSSWLGMSLARMTTERLDEATRESWIRSGEISEVARVRAFSALGEYPEELRAAPPGLPDHPALQAATKSDGSPNLNHAAYVGIARAYGQAALVVVQRRPDVYLGRVQRAFRTWLRPPTDYLYVVSQREALGAWDRLHSRLFLWSSMENRRAGPTLVLLPAALLFLLALARRPKAERSKLVLLMAFPLLAIAWNGVVENLVDVEENNRFRVEVEALIVVLGSWGAIDLLRRFLRRLRTPLLQPAPAECDRSLAKRRSIPARSREGRQAAPWIRHRPNDAPERRPRTSG